MKTFKVWDDSCSDRMYIEARSPREAAGIFLSDLTPDMYEPEYPGYGQVIVTVHVADSGDGYLGSFDMDLGAEPVATDWEPDTDAGGLPENPGVFGHGGGVIIYEVSKSLGLRRITDTWADDGHGGVRTAITYERL